MSRLLALVLLLNTAHALPLYTARSGRTCDNCHSLPNTWYDPEDIWERKCTLSCAGCHVDPSGGGLRTVSGRYYSEATLPILLGRNRPLMDQPANRHMIAAWARNVAQEAPGSQPSSQPASGPVKPVADKQVDPRGPDAPPATRGPTVFGTPAYAPSQMAWLDGRYDDLDADPALMLGGDFRLGAWTAGPLFFPMQGDIYVAVHPVEHLTVGTNVGIRGRNRHLTLEGVPHEDKPKFGVRDLWVMTHEYKGLAYARVGRFLPQFGTRVADHTAYIRRPFGFSQEDPSTRVIGAEVGFTGNYPYGAAAVFKPSTLDAVNPVATAGGYGASLSGGYRHMGWQVGGSAMVRQYDLSRGGDQYLGSVQWGVNPWYFWDGLPLTYLGEFTAGSAQTPASGRTYVQLAHCHQLAWTVFNGVVFRMRYDYWDPDIEVVNDAFARPGIGLDFIVLDGLGINLDSRYGIPERGESGPDFFGQIHGWF